MEYLKQTFPPEQKQICEHNKVESKLASFKWLSSLNDQVVVASFQHQGLLWQKSLTKLLALLRAILMLGYFRPQINAFTQIRI